MWGAAGAGIILVLLIAAAALLPRVLNTDAIGRNLASEFEARYHIRSERIKISFLPFPRVVMYGVGTTIPDTVTASAEAVILHPKILPLLMGKFAPAKIELLSPMITATLPEQRYESAAKSFTERLLHVKERISLLQATLVAAMPGVVINARNGGLELCCGQNRTFFFEEIDLRISVHAQKADFELRSGKSNLWRALTFSGRVDIGTLKGSGELNLTGGNPADLMRYLNTSASDKIGDSQIDLSITLSTGGPKSARADFTASVPQFTLEGGPQDPALSPQPPPEKGGNQQSVVMSNGALTGSLTIDTNGIDFSISHLQFDNPHLNLTASYVERYSDQSLTLVIEGRQIDAATARSILLTVDKENKGLRRVFEIIRKAQVPVIVFRSRAKNASDLKKYENFTLSGSLEKGVVFAPKAELLVSNVSGDVVVEDGILSAWHLSGQSAGSSTRDAELEIGLPHDNHLFHLDLPVVADLSELPDVLKRVVGSGAFRQELAQMKDVTGKAQGRLVLGENLKALAVKVETGPFHLAGRYGRFPDPLDLEGDSFLLEGSKVSVTSLSGKSGSSSFDHVDLSYDWGEAKVLEMDSRGKSVVSVDLLIPYLKTHESWKYLLDGTPKGSLAVKSIRLIGPRAGSSGWVLKASGLVEDVVVENKQLKGPLSLKTGAFEIDGDEVTLKGINAVMADSSLSISGNITGYLDHVKKLDLQLSGRLGPAGNKIAASLAGFPQALRAISNLEVQSSRLTWDNEPKTTFKGQMQLAAGPRITVDLVKTPRELSIENLVIKDEDSDATISTTFGQDQLEIGFSGKLSNKTADRLLIDNRLLTGPIEGKFTSHLYLDAPGKSSAQGEVSISGFQLPVNLPVPARIESAALEADGNILKVKSAMISWSGSRLSLAGSVAITGSAYLVDMNAFADTFDLESMLREMENGKGQEEVGPVSPVLSHPVDYHAQVSPQSPKTAWEAPFRGIIRVRSQYLSYGKITWNPANADVVLSPGSVDIRLTQANVCGISTPGSITISPGGLKISLSLSAKDQDIESTLACLFNKQHILSGSYTLTGHLAAGGGATESTSSPPPKTEPGKGGPEGAGMSAGGPVRLADSLEGEVEFKAKDGRIFRFDTLTKIISLLAVSEIYRGVVPDLAGEGCSYKSIEAKGKIKNGKLILSDSVVNGPCIKTVFRGEIDIARQKVDVVALVAPFRTVERVVNATPLMGKVLKEAFVTLPVHISGNLADPAVVLLSPSAVGEELFGVMKRVVKLPLTIFQPLVENEASPNKRAVDGGK